MIPFISRSPQAEQQHWVQALSDAMPQERVVLFDKLNDGQKRLCDVAIVADPDTRVLQTLPNLEWVHSVWAGVEGVIQELADPSFSIVRLVDPELTHTMSEAVLAWSLFLHREMYAYQHQQAEQRWVQRPMVRARQRRIGILGLGQLGKASAQRLRDNGFDVYGWSRNAKNLQGITCLQGQNGLQKLLQHSDILVCLLPLTAQTRGLLNARTLAWLPQNSTIINFGRGPIIDDTSLLKALDDHLAYAVLDVFEQEPLPRHHPYWQHPKVSVLPHISAPTHPCSASQIVAENIRRYRRTGQLPETVDTGRGY
ncbi:glyoxylate/hydroxypyruvate reductase A [Alteromonas sp. C1M14]|uniref:2-hydroxyacid dehydrogenase n=1 Tax=Alteromonas sp. C1M14 TaxID=2841567 RepID=UPI001C095F58|nr:glyoxylate/hydroxypyruvate reductase A [Alteromonas sp. C1M14]MBU2978047.1 glyoxylate/hydroxypyruvate reductase A [Alteromonas sp. C1M14]